MSDSDCQTVWPKKQMITSFSLSANFLWGKIYFFDKFFQKKPHAWIIQKKLFCIITLLFINKTACCQSVFPEHLTVSLSPVPAFLTKKTLWVIFLVDFWQFGWGNLLQMYVLVTMPPLLFLDLTRIKFSLWEDSDWQMK